MNAADYFQLIRATLPEIVMAITALTVLMLDVGFFRNRSRDSRRVALQAVFLIGVGLAAVAGIAWPFVGRTFGGLWALGPLGLLAKEAILVLAFLSVCLVTDDDWMEHGGEFFAVLALGVTGMLCMVSSDHLLMVFVSLELASLSLYILTAMNRGDRVAAESGLKYFLFGGMAAAFLLYGFSLLYGATGEMTLSGMAGKLASGPADSLVLMGLVMVLAGFGFKVAVVPFHWWAPDVYQGAPVPAAALIASGSKVASFFLMLKLLATGFVSVRGEGAWGGMLPGWTPVVGAVAALSMVMGNLAALGQRNVRRLLAYSAIAHGGYLLMGVIASGEKGAGSVLFYGLVYGFSTIGAFGIVSMVERSTGNDRFESFAGLSRRSPFLAFCLMILFLSLAGIPPLAGFFGKFYLFAAVAGVKPLGWMWLVGLGIGMSCVSLYYYLLVLKQAYVMPPVEGQTKPVDGPLLARLAVGVLVFLLLLLGILPDLLVSKIVTAFRAGLF